VKRILGCGQAKASPHPQNAEGSDDGSDHRRPPDNGRGGLQLGEDEGNASNRGRSRTKAEAREAEQHQPMDKFEPEIGVA
jgi:hypothetical protein